MTQDFFNTANSWANMFNGFQNMNNMNNMFNNNGVQNMTQSFAQAAQSFNQGLQEIVRRNVAAVQDNANRVFNNAKTNVHFGNTEDFVQNCNRNLHEQLHHNANHMRENAHVLFHSSLEAFDHIVNAVGNCCKQQCNNKKQKNEA